VVELPGEVLTLEGMVAVHAGPKRSKSARTRVLKVAPTTSLTRGEASEREGTYVVEASIQDTRLAFYGLTHLRTRFFLDVTILSYFI